jgi:hypothetical protein
MVFTATAYCTPVDCPGIAVAVSRPSLYAESDDFMQLADKAADAISRLLPLAKCFSAMFVAPAVL